MSIWHLYRVYNSTALLCTFHQDMENGTEEEVGLFPSIFLWGIVGNGVEGDKVFSSLDLSMIVSVSNQLSVYGWWLQVIVSKETSCIFHSFSFMSRVREKEVRIIIKSKIHI